MHTTVITLQIIMAVMFLLSVYMKVSRTPSMVRHWTEYRYPMWMMQGIAVLELLGVLGMIAAFRYPAAASYSAALLGVLMLGAIHAHLFRAKHKPVMAANAALMLACSIALIALQRFGA
ncbi:DoxX family protein [Paenibacillus flagellatus]|uniref:DoxX family protein n=1 Tax=Paenibacillus flagellatus TaxID=2211139 RepID=A0A2V5K0G5_9BACL|nr:DoxX family protein [Paenibacillus flagellatus]PYI52705.1 doxX family protein [Paenibacillus flagellatus]